MKPDRTWGLFLVSVTVTFGVLEGRAIRERNRGTRPSPTLTTTLRRWLGIDPRCGRRHVLGSLFLSVLVWFAGHIRLGWKP